MSKTKKVLVLITAMLLVLCSLSFSGGQK
ncbi:hypothetical protein LCGC14_2039620, partial [marine sediment metagenome]